MQNDIRLKIIDFGVSLEIIENFKNNWLYIKTISHGSERDSICAYFKFKLKDVTIFNNDFMLYGYEDDDRLYLNTNEIVQSECSPSKDEILFRIKSNDGDKEVYIKKYLPTLSTRLDELSNPIQNIIITEGQTDWKHLKNALKKLNVAGKFNTLDIAFFEYDQKTDMGNQKMKTIRDYHALLKNEYCKIFIFDRDVKAINDEFGEGDFLYHGNNVYSMLLPIPEHREKTPDISIEHYYYDVDLFKENSEGRRLYSVSEFDRVKKKHKSISNLYAIKLKKQSDIAILDDGVMKYDKKICGNDLSEVAKFGTNIALSKTEFVKYVEDEDVDVSTFSSIFNLIEEIIKDYISKKDNGIEISNGVYLENHPSGLSNLSLNAEIPEELLLLYKSTNLVGVEPVLLREQNKLILIISSIIEGNSSEILQFPIDISKELIDFIIKKEKNKFNRIELHLVSLDRKNYSTREILKDEISSTILLRALGML